jgi:hypothetical protein
LLCWMTLCCVLSLIYCYFCCVLSFINCYVEWHYVCWVLFIVMISAGFYLLLCWIKLYCVLSFIYCYNKCRFLFIVVLNDVILCAEFYLLLCWVVQIFIYCCAECRYTECLGALQTSFDHVNTKVFSIVHLISFMCSQI